MYINEIELKDFRNYKEQRISFNKKVNIFIGNNAQGKTNLLEGIYFNAIGKSFKNARDRELIRFGEEYFRIKTTAYIDGEENVTESVVSIRGHKGIKINGAKISKTSQLLEKTYVVIFSPEDLKIVKEDPDKRRRFIDRELCQIRKGYLSDLNSYRRIIKQRNAYLKEVSIDKNILSIWDEEMAEYGSRIIKRREDFLRKIDNISNQIHSYISGNKENLKIEYEPNVYFKENIKENFIELIKKNHDEDIKNRTTCIGPHRDDFSVSIENIDLRKFGSQGQQRTAALSLKLSEIKIIEEEKGEKPILLLDDVLSELDIERQSRLINYLGENQKFITTTDILGFVVKDMPEGKIFKITDGEVEIEI